MYFDGTQDSGYYVQDSIHLGATTVNSAIIAVVTNSVDRGYSIMGVGMDGLEATNTYYQGFIDDLVNQGIISKRAYSVYLDNLGKLSVAPSK